MDTSAIPKLPRFNIENVFPDKRSNSNSTMLQKIDQHLCHARPTKDSWKNWSIQHSSTSRNLRNISAFGKATLLVIPLTIIWIDSTANQTGRMFLKFHRWWVLMDVEMSKNRPLTSRIPKCGWFFEFSSLMAVYVLDFIGFVDSSTTGYRLQGLRRTKNDESFEFSLLMDLGWWIEMIDFLIDFVEISTTYHAVRIDGG